MAKALQCPACGKKTALTALGGGSTFPCPGCGQTLKIPAQLRRPEAAAGARRGGGRSSAPRPPGDGTSVMPTPAAPPAAPAAPAPSRRSRPQPPAKPHVAFPLRVLAWVIAVPVGGAIVWYSARKFGFLSGQRLLDVLVGSGWGRYGRVLLVAPVWALVTTLIVQLLLLLFRRLKERRQRIQSERAGASSSPSRDGRGRPSGRAHGARRATSRRPS